MCDTDTLPRGPAHPPPALLSSRRARARALGTLPGGHAGRGLADVADIMERHGGSLGIESREGQGTTVRLRLHASRFQIIPPSAAGRAPGEAGQAARVLGVDA